MDARVDLARLGALLGYLAFSVAWLVVLPLCLWQHGDHLAAALPWACNALCLPALVVWALRQRAAPAPAPAPALLPRGHAA
jgi:uncharacterized membrane protein